VPLLFHNAKFDLEVARAFFDLPYPPWERVHDTTFLAFLLHPNAETLSLKPLEKHLGVPPSEQLDLQEWIVTNVDAARRARTTWGAYIARAPARLVRPYAVGDVDRTWRLFRRWWSTLDEGMHEAYDRERRLIRVLLGMENRGVPVDVGGLEAAITRAEGDLERIDAWLRRRLRTSDLDIDKDEQLADALERAELVNEWILTDKTSRRSTSLPNLEEVLLDQKVLGALKYRALLTNQLRTFARPWLAMASSAEKIYCEWNQVRQASERLRGRAVGARTGRLSSTPNLQNVPKKPLRLVTTARQQRSLKRDGEVTLVVPIADLALIDLRALIAAPRGRRLFDLDYSQQELRILAHYAGGALLEAYRADPRLDLHTHAQTRINELLGTAYARRPIKDTSFGIIYGMGLGLLAEKIEEPLDTAKQIRGAYREIFPGLHELERECQQRGRRRERLRTWGGRLFEVEEPKYIKGKLRTFEYKLINTLIQGSAGDCTKQAMIDYDEDPDREGELLLSVHDQLLGDAPTRLVKRERDRLKKHMEAVEFALPMLTDATTGKTWRTCK
jgi:DNA polymerase-1